MRPWQLRDGGPLVGVELAWRGFVTDPELRARRRGGTEQPARLLRRRQVAPDHHSLSGLPDLQEIAAPVEAELDDEVAGLRGHSQCYSARSRRNAKNRV